MGQILFGGGVTAISGKVGGQVYARNKAGAYVRNWAKPTNTPSPSQSANRLAFGNVSKLWNDLTVLQRENWNTLAQTVTRLNRLGVSYVPTGRQIFLESANNMRVIGQTPLTDAPFSLLQPVIDTPPAVDFSVDAGAIDNFKLTGLSAIGGVSYVVDATKLFANQKFNFSTNFRQINTGVTVANIDLLTAYGAAYGTIGAVGDTYAIRLRYIDTANGMSSPVLQITGQTLAT